MAEEERKKKIELEDGDTRVKLPFRYLAHCIQVFGSMNLLFGIVLLKFGLVYYASGRESEAEHYETRVKMMLLFCCYSSVGSNKLNLKLSQYSSVGWNYAWTHPASVLQESCTTVGNQYHLITKSFLSGNIR